MAVYSLIISLFTCPGASQTLHISCPNVTFHLPWAGEMIFCNLDTCYFLPVRLWHSQAHTREREMFYLTTHSTHFIYSYMASDIWLRTILIVRKETRCRHIGYSYQLTARVLLYAPSHRQDSTYHGLCYTSTGWNEK